VFSHAVLNALLALQDLGKSSNDLLGRDFPIHGTSLEVKTVTPSATTFKVAGVRDTKSAAITGDIEAKYFNKANGLVFTQAWTTSNILRSQVELENYVAKGLKLDLTTTLLPDKGQKGAIVAATYKQPGLHSRAFLDVFKVCPPTQLA
jgi:voltage-dependent anion channel protein 2